MYRHKLLRHLIMVHLSNNNNNNNHNQQVGETSNDAPPTYSEISKHEKPNKNSAQPPTYSSVIMESVVIDNSETSTGTSIIAQPNKSTSNKSTSNKSTSNKSNKQKTIINQPKTSLCSCACCGCYNKESMDMRCCGICYCYYDNLHNQEQCNICPETLDKYCTSSYIVTECKPKHNTDDCDDCIPTLLCLPLKFSMCFPCLFGAIFNNSINYCRGTHANYCF